MLEPWNDKSLLAPPVNTFLCKNKIDFKSFTYTTNHAIEILTKQSPLHKESAILSRFLYKFDKKFRNDIGYRILKKVKTALKKYLTLKLIKILENFSSVLPKGKENDLYMPTRQMLEYVMIKIMCFSKLMVRIAICSKQAAIFYLDRIKHGEAHWMSLMPYALLCRIWSIALVLVNHSYSWYNQFYSNLDKLELKGVGLLPNYYKLPVNLEKWLDLNNLNDYGRFEWRNKIKINIEPLFIDGDGGDDLCENILDYVNQINEDIDKTNEFQIEVPSIQDISPKEDTANQNEIGVAISRNNIEKYIPIKKENKHSAHSIDTVTNNTSLNEFLFKEEELRNESDSNALTSHLSFMQWQALKKSLQNINCDKTVPRKLNRKIQSIWKEKCLDYK